MVQPRVFAMQRPLERSAAVDGLDGSSQPKKLSKPQKRRRRIEKLAAARAANPPLGQENVGNDVPHDGDAPHLKDLEHRLDALQHLIINNFSYLFACFQLGSGALWKHHYLGTPADVEVTASNLNPCASNLNPCASSFVPSSATVLEPAFTPVEHNTPLANSSGSLIKAPVPLDVTTACPSRVSLEALQEAATSIQKVFRGHRARLHVRCQACLELPHGCLCEDEREQGNQDNENMHALICGACGQDLEDICGSTDACDDCGSPHHPHCLKKVQHPIEPYRLCNACISLRGVEAETLSSHGSSDGGKDTEKQCIELLTTVDGRLDFMVKYLELDHQGVLTKAFRDSVSQKVRKTMKWKKKMRSTQALKDKIADLDKFMQNILNK